MSDHFGILYFNPFQATGLFLYPMTTSKNFWFSDVFRGYKKRPVAWNGLTDYWDKSNDWDKSFHRNPLILFILATTALNVLKIVFKLLGWG